MPVGHDDDELAEFPAHVERLIADLEADTRGIVGRRPELFTFSRARRAIRSIDGSWPCNRVRDSGTSTVHVPDGVSQALFEALPGRTVVVEITNRAGGRGRPNSDAAGELSASGHAAIRMAADHDARTLDHELGHALVGLEDEYTDEGATGCYPNPLVDLPPGIPQPYPNLSPHADGRDWGGLVSGAEPGGAASYDSCIYHPTKSCRMLGSRYHDHYCPVCDRAIDHALARAAGDEEPEAIKCVVSSTPTEDALAVRVVGWSRSSPVTITLRFGSQTAGFHTIVRDSHALTPETIMDLHYDISWSHLGWPVGVECADASGREPTQVTIEE